MLKSPYLACKTCEGPLSYVGGSRMRPFFQSARRSGRVRRGEMENRLKECQGDLFAITTCDTIRLKLLKLGALVTISARHI
jgi:hypothetical protein